MVYRFALLFFIFLLTTCADPKDRPISFVIFIADDVSWNDLGAYGNQAVSSPFIDSLARDGLVFTNMFLTTSSCSPSRASILTGRYPHNTGAPELHMPLPDDMHTIGDQLNDHGYFVGASGKWHLGEEAKEGFDQVMDTDTGPGGEERWEELITEIPPATPYFLWMASFDAHRGWDDNDFAGRTDTSQIMVPPYMIRDSATIEDFTRYYDEIARFDDYVRKSVELLRERRLLNNTIIMIMADNGRPFPRDKTRLYDSGIKTPFILWAPDHLLKTRGTSTEALVSVIDIAPAMAEWSGRDPLNSFQGLSFAHLLNAPANSHRSYVFAEHNWHDYTAHERMVRSGDFLLIENSFPEKPMSGATDIHNSPTFATLVNARNSGTLDSVQFTHFQAPRPATELYNVKNDPHQLRNLALQAEYQVQLRALREVLNNWKDETGDNVPATPTKDKYDFLTAEPYEADRHYADIDRGEIPGAATRAFDIISTDSSFLSSK